MRSLSVVVHRPAKSSRCCPRCHRCRSRCAPASRRKPPRGPCGLSASWSWSPGARGHLGRFLKSELTASLQVGKWLRISLVASASRAMLANAGNSIRPSTLSPTRRVVFGPYSPSTCTGTATWTVAIQHRNTLCADITPQRHIICDARPLLISNELVSRLGSCPHYLHLNFPSLL